MFGRKNRVQNGGGETASQKSAAQPQLEIPQQIYNTLDSGNRQKRRLIILGVVGLGLLILLTIGGIRLFSSLADKDTKPTTSSASDNEKTKQPGAAPSKPQTAQDKQAVSQSQQAPQNGNTAVPKTSGQPTSFEGNGAQNNGFATQPR